MGYPSRRGRSLDHQVGVRLGQGDGVVGCPVSRPSVRNSGPFGSLCRTVLFEISLQIVVAGQGERLATLLAHLRPEPPVVDMRDCHLCRRGRADLT